MDFTTTNMKRGSSNIIYTKDLQGLINVMDNDPSTVRPNTIIVTSYEVNTVKTNNEYKGTSYEMFYIDNNKKINRLSYGIQEGNGLTVSDYQLYLGVDNETIKYQGSKKTLYIDNDKLKNANYKYKGVAKGDNNIYIDTFITPTRNSGTVSSKDGEIFLNSGVMIEMREISYYFNKYKDVNDLIVERINELTNGHIFQVGDLLFRNPETKELSFRQVTNKYVPYMVCIIASNVLDDRYPRFIPIQNNIVNGIISQSNSVMTGALYDKVPVFESDLHNIEYNQSIITAAYGYIATNQDSWFNNFENPLYKNVEHYFAFDGMEFNSEIDWGVWQDGAHIQGLYSIEKGTIATESIEAEDGSSPSDDISLVVNIEFNDGFSSDYNIDLEWNTEENNFQLKETVQPTGSNRTDQDNTNLSCRINLEPVCSQIFTCSENCHSLSNLSSNPYNFGSKKELEIPEELKDYIRTDAEASKENISTEELVFGRVETMQVHDNNENGLDDCGRADRYNFSNEMYYGCGGGCGTNCPSQNYCSGNCGSACSCVGGNCPSDCGCDGYTPCSCVSGNTQEIYTSSYTFALNIKGNLMQEEDLQKCYLKMYVETDSNKFNPSRYYLAEYNNQEITYIFTKYNTPDTEKNGSIMVIAYGSVNFVDKHPLNLGILPIVSWTENKSDLPNNKEYSFSNIYTTGQIYTKGIYGDHEQTTAPEDPDHNNCISDTGCHLVICTRLNCTGSDAPLCLNDDYEDDIQNNTDIINTNYYKLTYLDIPFDFNINNIRINKITKVTKTGNEVIKLMKNEGSVNNIGVNGYIQYKCDLSKLRQIQDSESYLYDEGFIILYCNEEVDSQINIRTKETYFIDIQIYFYPYKDRINGVIRRQSIFLNKIPLKLENTTDEIFISTAINNTEYKILDNIEKRNIAKVVIKNIYRGDYILYTQIAKSAQLININ